MIKVYAKVVAGKCENTAEVLEADAEAWLDAVGGNWIDVTGVQGGPDDEYDDTTGTFTRPPAAPAVIVSPKAIHKSDFFDLFLPIEIEDIMAASVDKGATPAERKANAFARYTLTRLENTKDDLIDRDSQKVIDMVNAMELYGFVGTGRALEILTDDPNS